MPQSMQVVRGLLAANPDYWPAKTNADGTTSSAYLRATVYEDRPRVRQKDGSYTDNPLGPVRTTVKFWGQAAELLHGMDFRQATPWWRPAAWAIPTPSSARRTARHTRVRS